MRCSNDKIIGGGHIGEGSVVRRVWSEELLWGSYRDREAWRRKYARGMRCGTSYWQGEVLGKKQGKRGTGKGVGRKILLGPENLVKKKTRRRKQGKK